MLRVSIHSGKPADVSRLTRTDWLDIGYETRGLYSTYKVMLFQKGIGETPQAFVRDYPRWSASLWDLVARATAAALWPEPTGLHEALPPPESVGSRCAHIHRMTAIIMHQPDQGSATRQLGLMSIAQSPHERGLYAATIAEDTQGRRSCGPFRYDPKKLRPAELMLRAAAHLLNDGKPGLPPRPTEAFPAVDEDGGRRFVRVSKMREPARTGLLRWMGRTNQPLDISPSYPAGRVPEALFRQFLESVI